jgi:secondary thiamine-phosphate synthase enzyme
MSAHLRSAVTATSLAIPVQRGELALGTWQAVYLVEHRTAPHERRIVVTVLGAS